MMAPNRVADSQLPHLYEVEKYSRVIGSINNNSSPAERNDMMSQMILNRALLLDYRTINTENTRIHPNELNNTTRVCYTLTREGDLCQVIGLTIQLSNLYSDSFHKLLSWGESKQKARDELLSNFISMYFRTLDLIIGGTLIATYPIALFASSVPPTIKTIDGRIAINVPINLHNFFCTIPSIAIQYNDVSIHVNYYTTPLISKIDLNVKYILCGSTQLRQSICSTPVHIAYETFHSIMFKQLNKTILKDTIVINPHGGNKSRGFFYFGNYRALNKITLTGTITIPETANTAGTAQVAERDEIHSITFTKEDLKKYASPVGTMGNLLYVPFSLGKKFKPINKTNPLIYLDGVFFPTSRTINVDCEWSWPIKTYGISFIAANIFIILNGMSGSHYLPSFSNLYESSEKNLKTETPGNIERKLWNSVQQLNLRSKLLKWTEVVRPGKGSMEIARKRLAAAA